MTKKTEGKVIQRSDCCKEEIRLTGSPNHEDGFACMKCGRTIGTPITPQQPEGEWEREFDDKFVTDEKHYDSSNAWEVLLEPVRLRDIKNFIRTLLSKKEDETRREEREKIVRLIKNNDKKYDFGFGGVQIINLIIESDREVIEESQVFTEEQMEKINSIKLPEPPDQISQSINKIKNKNDIQTMG